MKIQKATVKKLHHCSDLKALEKIAEAKGFRSAPRDHGIYSEGQTIVFVRRSAHRAPLRSPQKTPDSPNVDAASGVAHGHE